MNSFESTPITSVEDFWDRRPCNVRHSPLPVGTREYFDQVAERRYFVEPHIRSFADFPRWEGRRVLEIGCGIGTDAVSFARAGARVTAVDLSQRSLDIARQHALAYGVADRIDFLHSDAETLNKLPADELFDLVYSFGVIHHTPHPQSVLAAVLSRMARDAEFRVMVYHRHSWKVGQIMIRNLRSSLGGLDRAIAEYSEAQTGSPVTYTYTRRSITELLTASGYAVDSVKVAHIFPFKAAEYRAHRYVRQFPFNVFPQQATDLLAGRFGWHLLVVAKPRH